MLNVMSCLLNRMPSGAVTDNCLGLLHRLLVVLTALPLTSAAQIKPPPEILIIGSYHMANRGHDIYNMHADDVLLAKRQQEITQVIEVLKKFHPTKIAIEADVDKPKRSQGVF
jgi:hypothetical protein